MVCTKFCFKSSDIYVYKYGFSHSFSSINRKRKRKKKRFNFIVIISYLLFFPLVPRRLLYNVFILLSLVGCYAINVYPPLADCLTAGSKIFLCIFSCIFFNFCLELEKKKERFFPHFFALELSLFCTHFALSRLENIHNLCLKLVGKRKKEPRGDTCMFSCCFFDFSLAFLNTIFLSQEFELSNFLCVEKAGVSRFSSQNYLLLW